MVRGEFRARALPWRFPPDRRPRRPHAGRSRSKAGREPAGLEIAHVGSWRLNLHAPWRGQLPDLGLVVLMSAVPLRALRPLQNATFIDDWTYPRSVEHLLRTGELKSLAWAVSQNQAHGFGGASCCAPFGFSCTP